VRWFTPIAVFSVMRTTLVRYFERAAVVTPTLLRRTYARLSKKISPFIAPWSLRCRTFDKAKVEAYASGEAFNYP
jgi:hypothetical protein